MLGSWGRRGLTAFSIALLYVAVLVRDGARVEATASFDIRPCANSHLLIAPTIRGLGAAAGHVGRWYRIHLLWGSACSLQGFPRVELLDADFHTISIQVGHGGQITGRLPRPRVLIDRHHDAYFALEFTDVLGCRSSPYLMIFPPLDTLPVVTDSGGVAACPHNVDSSPVEAGTTLP
jgi:hypothetical protein